MSLESSANIATIVAAIIASGAIISWFRMKLNETKPLKLINSLYSKEDEFDGAAHFVFELKNKLHVPIVIESAALLTRKIYPIEDIEGKLWRSPIMGYASETIECDEEVAPGARVSIYLKFQKTSDANPVFEMARNISLITDRGGFYLPIKNLVVSDIGGGEVRYSDRATSKLGHFIKLIRYFWWRYLLNDRQKKDFARRDII